MDAQISIDVIEQPKLQVDSVTLTNQLMPAGDGMVLINIDPVTQSSVVISQPMVNMSSVQPMVIEVGLQNPQSTGGTTEPGQQQVFVQQTAPVVPVGTPYFWIQTYPDSSAFQLWFDDNGATP